MADKFEEVLGFHCAPTLMGLKPANLVCFSRKQFLQIDELLQSYNTCFQPVEIILEPLWKTEKRVMVLVYQKDALSAALNDRDNRALLLRYGYTEEMSCEHCLNRLKQKAREQGGCPHEIGIFLGYPIEDVIGFIQNNGKKCQACGCWKVYGNVESKLRLFELYSHCRHTVCRALARGVSLQQLARAV